MQEEKQTIAIIKTLQRFLNTFNVSYDYMEKPKETLDEFFDLVDWWDWVVYVGVKTPEGTFSHWYILDIPLSDTESIIKWIKKYTENVLRFEFHINV